MTAALNPWLMLAAVLVSGPAHGSTPPPQPESRMSHPASAGVTDPQLAVLLEEHWESMMKRWPTWATKLGDHRYDLSLIHISEPTRPY